MNVQDLHDELEKLIEAGKGHATVMVYDTRSGTTDESSSLSDEVQVAQEDSLEWEVLDCGDDEEIEFVNLYIG